MFNGICHLSPICYAVYPSISPSDWRLYLWSRWREDNYKRFKFRMLRRYRKIEVDSRFSAAEDRGQHFVCGTAAAKVMSFISFYLPLSTEQAELAKVELFNLKNEVYEKEFSLDAARLHREHDNVDDARRLWR